MQLTKWTDYSLRVLMYCAAHAARATPVTISEIGQAHRISRSHLTKVVMTLAALGYLETTRGRGGGLRLLAPASETRVGDVVRHTETDFTLLECFDPVLNTCALSGHCRLESVLHEAMARFLEMLDGVTLADLMTPAVLHFPLPTSARVAGPTVPTRVRKSAPRGA
jgi:Rrf2 family nitric oxide-sensitive transcriptional repressor